MTMQSIDTDATVLVAGEAEGSAMVLEQTLSFWGGFDPVDGEIIDVHHPQYRQRVTGRVLCITRSKGSAGTPGGIAETLRRGSGPLAFVLGEPDVNISIGVLVANRLYGLQVPVVQVSADSMALLQNDDRVTISADAGLSILREG